MKAQTNMNKDIDSETNTNEERALLHILGTIDGTLEPQTFSEAVWQADAQITKAYRETGAVTIPNAGKEAASRKRYERAVESLLEAGLIFKYGKKIGLTPSGDETARRLAGLPTLKDSLPLLAAVFESKEKWSDGCVSESTLCGLAALPPCEVIGVERTPSKLVGMFMPHALPLIAARLLSWREFASHDGVLLYHTTNEGLKLAKKSNAQDWHKKIRRPKSYGLPEEYFNSWKYSFHARQTATPENPNLVQHLDYIMPPKVKTEKPLKAV